MRAVFGVFGRGKIRTCFKHLEASWRGQRPQSPLAGACALDWDGDDYLGRGWLPSPVGRSSIFAVDWPLLRARAVWAFFSAPENYPSSLAYNGALRVSIGRAVAGLLDSSDAACLRIERFRDDHQMPSDWLTPLLALGLKSRLAFMIFLVDNYDEL